MIKEYISQFPEEVQNLLENVRAIILEEVPEVEEKISYGIPGYYLMGKPLVYFAGYKKHIGFYATPNGHDAFEEDFSKYKQGKGSVQFQLNKEIPFDLIRKVVQFRKEHILKQG